MKLVQVLSENMKAIRHIMSQEKLAKILEISKFTVQSIEHQTSSATLNMVDWIAERMHIPSSELLTEHPSDSLEDWAIPIRISLRVMAGSRK